jgi:hypothetical protein
MFYDARTRFGSSFRYINVYNLRYFVLDNAPRRGRLTTGSRGPVAIEVASSEPVQKVGQ